MIRALLKFVWMLEEETRGTFNVSWLSGFPEDMAPQQGLRKQHDVRV